MLSIGGGVGLAAAVSPDLLLRAFGATESLTPGGRLGWRLFAARNIYLTARALQGDRSAEDAYAPLQALDQLAFWAAVAERGLPRRTTSLAIAASGAIVVLDRIRRG